MTSEGESQDAGRIRAAKAADWFGVGKSFLDQGRWEEASLSLQQAVAGDPTHADAWAALGTAEQNLGHLQNALIAYDRSLAIAPDQPGLVVEVASVLSQLGQAERAVMILRNLLLKDSGFAAGWTALGDALRHLNRCEEALDAYLRAQSLGPPDFDAFLTMAKLRMLQYALPEAEALLRRIVSDDPKTAPAWTLLGEVQRAQGRVPEAIDAIRRSVELALNPDTHSKLLLTSQYVDDPTPERLREDHRQWDAAYSHPLQPIKHNQPAKAKTTPLRLGFCSLNFKRHPIGYLTLRPIECLDKNACSVVCYSDYDREDDFTVRFRNASSLWRVTNELSAEELAQQITQDEIDVLIDLEGHTADRMPVFARKPAPMQMTWLGYVGTTGLTAMDYLLADRFHVQPGEEGSYVESILRMPQGYACYNPGPETPEVSILPALRNQCVTFSCFNNPAKFSPRIIEAWAGILKQVPTAQLLFKYHGLSSPQVQNDVRARFAQHHVNPQRILIERESDWPGLMSAYNRVDIALDTQPYSGGVTTCEALWMGVPAITFPGKTFAGRHATSHLMNAGYPQFVAANIDGYVELAVHWAQRLDELAEIRAGMRAQVRHSPLCDAPRFANDFLHVLHKAYEARVIGGA